MATLEAEKEYARILESDLPLRHLKPYFPDWESVLEHHVDEMSLKYSAHVNESLCQGCSRGPATERRRFLWQADYDTAGTAFTSFLWSALTLHIRHRYMRINFSTVHCLCQNCTHGIRLKAIAGQSVGKLAGGLFWLSLLGVIVFVILAGYYISSRARSHDLLVAFGCLAASGALMALTLWGMQVRRKWGIPAKLRKVAKSPFQLESIQTV